MTPIITLWGHFQTPICQNAQWCQSGINLYLCQDMLKSQKQQKNCNYRRLQSCRFILLFVKSTTLKSLSCKFKHLYFLTLMITLWGHFETPIFQNAQWYQSGISLFPYQEMSVSQKQSKHCNYTWLQGVLLCQLDYYNSSQFWVSFAMERASHILYNNAMGVSGSMFLYYDAYFTANNSILEVCLANVGHINKQFS